MVHEQVYRTARPARGARRLAAMLAAVAACLALAMAVQPPRAFAQDHVAAVPAPDAPAATVANGTYRISCSTASGIALECPKGTTAKGRQMRVAKKAASANQKFYVRNEGGGLVSIQSVASGLYLAQRNGKVVQLPDAESADRRWKLVSSSGLAIVNAESGDEISLAAAQPKAGAKAVASADGAAASQRWRLSGVKLVADGYYQLKSLRGGYLGAARASYAAGAALRVATTSAKKAEVFDIRAAKGGWLSIESTRSFLALGASGKAAVQQTASGKSAQLWKASLDRSGGLVFKNKKAKGALGIAKKPSRAGVAAGVGAFAGKAGQRWQLVASQRYSLSGDGALDRQVAAILAKYPTLRKAYDHVAFDFRYLSANEIRSGKYLSTAKSIAYAKQFIRNGGGNCYRFSAVMSWLARGLGYSSRVVTGWVPGNLEPHAPHGWCEVYKNGKTYICDPDMYNAVRNRNWYLRTYANAPVAYGFW